jgi:CDP-diacylglycerol---glycerol-3-phosphate 3-phosphatidyltransferase
MSFPTQLTVLRMALVPVFYLLLTVVEPAEVTWAAVVFGIAALSDWYDGYVARKWNLMTSLGAFLDPLADKLLTGSAFVAFAWLGLIPWWMVALVLLRDIYLTVFRILSDGIGLSVKTSAFAKAKTFVQMVFIANVLIGLVLADGAFGVGIVTFGYQLTKIDLLYAEMLLVTLLTTVSAVLYSYDNWTALVVITRRYILRRSPQKL